MYEVISSNVDALQIKACVLDTKKSTLLQMDNFKLIVISPEMTEYIHWQIVLDETLIAN